MSSWNTPMWVTRRWNTASASPVTRSSTWTNLYAGAADPMDEEDPYLTRNSEHFHEAIGYKPVARYHGCGNKFGRWYNLLWMEKIINEHSVPPKEVVPFSKLDESAVKAILES